MALASTAWLVLPVVQPGQSRPEPVAPPTSDSPPSTTRPAGATPFQPGVWIDWTRRSVTAAGFIVLDEGPLELLACFHGKEHESIVKFDCRAEHLFMALGLVGLAPGHPPRWNEQRRDYEPAAGDLVDVIIEWQAGGRTHQAHAFEWLREIEFGRNPVARPFVFAGSRLLPDGTLAADLNGIGISIVDQAESLLCLSRSHSDRNEELWAVADGQNIPPLDTPVKLVFRAAQRRPRNYAIDFRGAAYVDGVYCEPADFSDLLRIDLALAGDGGAGATAAQPATRPAAALRIDARPALPADVARWKRWLGPRLDAERIEFVTR